MIRRCIWSVIIVLLVTLPAGLVFADSGARLDRDDAARLKNVDQFNLQARRPLETVFSEEESAGPSALFPQDERRVPRSLGSALSPNSGIGVGESIAITYDDRQVFYPVGRHIAHYYNTITGDVDVHFCYEMARDTVLRRQENLPLRQTGYNVYSASEPGGDWPQGGQDIGCTIQGADTIGFGRGGNMVISPNGLAVFVAYSSFFSPENPTVGFVRENKLFYQLSQWNCVYSNDPLIGNVTAPDSGLYKPLWTQPNRDGNLSAFPSIATQIDGSGQLITHMVVGENANWDPPPGLAGYPTGGGSTLANYRVFAYLRKVGSSVSSGWSAGVIVDTIERNFYDLVADPKTPRVCIAYSNPSYSGRLLNNAWDKDCYYRESPDYGLSWGSEVNITNFRNDLDTSLGFGGHYRMYYECKALYTTDGNLHILFQNTPASESPYQDGYYWTDFNQDIAHWDRVSGDYVRVADGTYMNSDYLTGTVNGIVCGYGHDPSGYAQFFNISECDGKIFAVWNQIHEGNNRLDYLTHPEVIDDCSYTVTSPAYGNANEEIFMSVATMATPTLWDQPRNLTNTYTPDCGFPWDPDAPNGLCGSEFKPYVEPYALNEAGLSLTWPAGAIVDATPIGEPRYNEGWYLNAEYMDDQFPGPAWDTSAPGRGVNGFITPNSMKWIRIACVDPIEAALIEAMPREFEFPIWVKAGESRTFPITVFNWGNVVLNVNTIGKTTGAGWLSADSTPTALDPFTVEAGLDNTNKFAITVDASSITQPTWLTGDVWLLSDAADYDSFNIHLRVLAADTVEPVVWDTVATAQNMFHPFLAPQGACVGLALGNMGELGWGGGTGGRVNLDYTDARNMVAEHRECDTTKSYTRRYLVGGTPFTLLANAGNGSGAELTQVFNDLNQVDVTGFDPTPDKGSLKGGLTAGGAYDSAYTGRFVNRDTSIAMERIVYGPRSATPATAILNFMIVYTKVYSADGLGHNHVTIGDAMDFDVPSHNYNHNLGGIVVDSFVYLRGTDTVGDTTCVRNVGRYATHAFGGGYTSVEFLANNCVNNFVYQGSRAIDQLIMVDSVENNGEPVDPIQPNPLAWWTEASVGGLSLVEPIPDTGRDLATFLTYKYDYSLGALDTLHYWTVLTTTPIGGTLDDLKAQVTYAKTWYMETVRGCVDDGCCVGRVGDANGSHEAEDEVTLGDIMLMVDVLFISSDCSKLTCLEEADVTQSPGTPLLTCTNYTEYVTLGDIMTLVDHLFISTAPLKACL